jgi:hypothetical protein
VLFLVTLLLASPALAAIIGTNGSFEEAILTQSWKQYDASDVPGWQTTSNSNVIELWNGNEMSSSLAGDSNDFSYLGDQHAELNARTINTLFQDIANVSSDQLLNFEFAHRGRSGDDTIRFSITDFGKDNIWGNTDDTSLFSQEYTTGKFAWNFYSSNGLAPIHTLGNTLRFSFDSVSSAGNDSYGNSLDAVQYTADPVPEPATMLLFGTGLAGLAGSIIRRKKRQ